MKLERRIWYPGVPLPVIQRTKDRGPLTTWPEIPVPGWDTIEVVRRPLFVPWAMVIFGFIVILEALLVLFGLGYYPRWIQVFNAIALGMWLLAAGSERLLTGRRKKP